MARIIIETDRGTATLSERLATSTLQQDDYAEKLMERVGWSLADAESADGEERFELESRSTRALGRDQSIAAPVTPAGTDPPPWAAL